MVQGGMTCVKYLLFIFNLIFFLAGLALIVIGSLALTHLSAYLNAAAGSFSSASILIIVIGAVILVIAFFGCCGAYKENYCMVITFLSLLIIIFILEIAAGITAYVKKNDIDAFLNTTYSNALKNYGRTGHEDDTSMWDLTQLDFDCCGVASYKDWNNAHANMTNGDVPDSCCKKQTKHCGAKQATYPSNKANSTIFTDGCVDIFESWVISHTYIVGGVATGLAILQIIGIVLACCLSRAIKKEYEVV